MGNDQSNSQPDFGALASALSPQELQTAHTALYMMRNGVGGYSRDDFDQDKVAKAWDAIQPVVARGGGAAQTTRQAVGASPAYDSPDTRGPLGKLVNPSEAAVNRTANFISGGEVKSASQYDTYLENPAIPKTWDEAFRAATLKSISELTAAQTQTPAGVATLALGPVEGLLSKGAVEGIQVGRGLSKAAMISGDAADSARAVAAITKANRLANLAKTTAISRVAIDAGFGAGGAQQVYDGKTLSDKAAGLGQMIMGAVGAGRGIDSAVKLKPSIVMAGFHDRVPETPQTVQTPEEAAQPQPQPAQPQGAAPVAHVPPTPQEAAPLPSAEPAAWAKDYWDEKRAAELPELKTTNVMGATSKPDTALAPSPVQKNAEPLTAQQVVDKIGVKKDGLMRPSGLPDDELKSIAGMPQKDTAALGLTRDDHLAAVAEANRRFGDAPSQKPVEDIHTAISRITKAKTDPGSGGTQFATDLERRSAEFKTQLSTLLKADPETQARTADSLDQRAQLADMYSQNLRRVMDAKDFAGEVSAARAQNKMDNPGMMAVIDPESGVTVGQKRDFAKLGSYQVSTESKYLDAVAGRTSVSLEPQRDPNTGKIQRQPPATAEEAQSLRDFTKRALGQLNDHLQEVRAQGGVPTPEQKVQGMGFIDAVEAGTGLRFAFKGKSSRFIDPDQATVAQWMGAKPKPGNISKPSVEAVNRRLERLALEGDLSRRASKAVRDAMPADREGSAQPNKVVAQTATAPTATQALTPEEAAATTPKTAQPTLQETLKQEVAKVDYRNLVEGDRPNERIAAKLVEQHTVSYKDALQLANDKLNEKWLKLGESPVKAEPVKAAPAAAPPKTVTAEIPHYDSYGKLIDTRKVDVSTEPIARPGETPTEPRSKAYMQEKYADEFLKAHERAERRATGPKMEPLPDTSSADGKSDALYERLTDVNHAMEIPSKVMSAMTKLHGLTPEMDRDQIAAAIAPQYNKPALTGEGKYTTGTLDDQAMALRYATSMNLLRQGLRAGDAQALDKAVYFAQHGHEYSPNRLIGPGGKGQEGFVLVPQVIPNMIRELGKYATNAPVAVGKFLGWTKKFLTEGTWMDVDHEFKDAFYHFKGQVTKQTDLARIAFNDSIQAINKMGLVQQLNMFKKASKGEDLGEPSLQGQRDILQQLQDRAWVKMRQAGSSVAYWQNHIGTLWKTPPLHSPELYERDASAINKAVLEGDKGMFRKRIYEHVVAGMADGGVPVTKNLFEMALLDLGRQHQYIHAQELLQMMKNTGRLVQGEGQTSGMTHPKRVDDNVVSTWFPAKLASGGTGMMKGESWYMERGELNAFQNWLSPDFIRKNVVGRAFMGMKNIYTPIELLGPFHAASMVVKSQALALAQGTNRAFNVGVLQNQPIEAVKGLADVMDAWRAPYKMYKEGRALQEAGGQMLTAYQKFNYDKQQWLATPNGQRLQKLYPNIDKVIDSILEGGAHIGVNPDYATKWRRSMVDAFKEGLPLKAAAQLPLAGLESLTAPLFSHYIPALKLGAMARELQVEMKRNAPMIASGEISEAAVGQKAVRRVDNILGEFNWDNLNASKSMKTVFQFVYRSPTWRLGTLDLTKNAIQGQLGEFAAPLTQGRAPNIHPDALNFMSQVVVGSAIGATFMTLYAHKQPQTMTDLLHPQTGELDSRGKPMRLDDPTYVRDFEQILTSLQSYLTGGQSGLMNSAAEMIKNRDFSGSLITEKSGVAGWPRRLAHLAPVPFVVTGYQKMTREGFSGTAAAGLEAMGFNPARKDLDMTPAEKILSESERHVQYTYNTQQRETHDAIRQIESAYANHRMADASRIQKDAIRKGVLTFDQADKAVDTAMTPYIQRMASTVAKEGTKADLIKAYEVGSQKERNTLGPLIYDAIDNAEGPEQQQLQKAFQQARKTSAAKP